MVRWISLIGLVLVGLGCATSTPGPDPQPPQPPACPSTSQSGETGKASYYADRLHGNSTASGEPYDKNALTAAHKTLSFGTVVCVTNVLNDQSVTVRINDRGPFVSGRVIDLSRGAAERIGLIRAGIADVRVQVLSRP